MSKRRFAGVSAAMLLAVCAPLARAEDISARKLLVKDNAKPAKRSVLVQSSDAGVQFSEADTPSANGASVHLYSATDDVCVLLPAGSAWKSKKSTWKYKSKGKSAMVKNRKLMVEAKGIAFSLADNGSQGPVNAQVQFGTGTKYCMRCTGNKKNDAKQFHAMNCVAAACDPEPPTCGSASATTTTIPGTVTTTTVPGGGGGGGGAKLKGALTPTTGRFNYNLTLGLPGADAACNTNFPGTHACTYADLQAAATAGELAGLRDTANGVVTSFWAIDSTHADVLQCKVTVAWDYATAHTGQFGEKVDLNNAAGTLGPLMSGLAQNVFCANQSWVGCCL
jgi:hypothetical protein